MERVGKVQKGFSPSPELTEGWAVREARCNMDTNQSRQIETANIGSSPLGQWMTP